MSIPQQQQQQPQQPQQAPRPGTGVPQAAAGGIAGKRTRDQFSQVSPPNIPDGLRAAAQPPTAAKSLIDPIVQAVNESRRREREQQQQAGEPAAKKAKVDGEQEAQDATASPEDQEPGPVTMA